MRGQSMRQKTVIIVQRLGDYADTFADWLGSAGYRVLMCPGPKPPSFDCWAYQYRDCPLWDQADLLIYDPWLSRDSATYGSEPMLTLEHGRHPEKPVLIWGSGAAVPREIVEMQQPGFFEVLPLEITAATLVAAVNRMIGPADSTPQAKTKADMAT